MSYIFSCAALILAEVSHRNSFHSACVCSETISGVEVLVVGSNEIVRGIPLGIATTIIVMNFALTYGGKLDIVFCLPDQKVIGQP